MALAREAISIDHRLHGTQDLALELTGLAAALALTGDHEIAARLLGHTDAMFEALGASRTLWDRERYDKTMESLRRSIDPAKLDAAIEAGRRMTRDEIVALALGDEAPDRPNQAGPA